METPEQIAAKSIKIRLAELGLKPSDLVSMTGLSRQTITKILNGDRQTRVANLTLIAEKLGTTREWLLAPKPNMTDLTVKSAKEAKTQTSETRNELIVKLLDVIVELSEPLLIDVLTYAQNKTNLKAR